MTSAGHEVADLSPAWSNVSLGVMTFGDQVTDQGEADRMVQMARDAGVTLFDTADSYHAGASEQMLGRSLAGSRDEVLIASKVGNKVDDDPSHRGLRPEWIRHSVEGSLKRLGTDYVDVYYLHLPDRQTPIEESLGTLSELVREGKVLVPAVSNYAAWEMANMDCLSDQRGWPRVGAAQVLYNAIARRLDDEFVSYAAQADLFTVVYNPLAGGLLTGKHRPDATPEDGRFALSRYRDRYWNERQFEAVRELGAVADEAGIPLLDLALRWVLSRDAVDSVLLGASSESQLAANLEACAAGPLPADVLARCDDVWPIAGGTAPRYNR